MPPGLRARLSAVPRYGAALALAFGIALLPVSKIDDDLLSLLPALILIGVVLMPRGQGADLLPFLALGLLAVAFVGWLVLLSEWHDTPRRLTANVKHPLLAIAAALFLRLYAFPDAGAYRRYLLAFALSGACIAMAMALWQSLPPDMADFEGRAHGNTNPIPFSECLMTAAGIAAILLSFRPEPWARPVCAVLLCLAILAVHATGTRGTFLAIFALLGGLALSTPGPKRLRRMGFLVPPLILAVVLMLTAQRSGLAVAEMSASLGGDASGSVGLRLQMWQAAWAAFRDAPLIGHGMRPLHEIIDPALWPDITQFRHAHNQILDYAAKGGAPAALIYLAIHLVALIAGLRWMRDGVNLVAGACLVWASGSFLIYGLTQAFMMHESSGTTFVAYLALAGLAGVRAPANRP